VFLLHFYAHVCTFPQHHAKKSHPNKVLDISYDVEGETDLNTLSPPQTREGLIVPHRVLVLFCIIILKNPQPESDVLTTPLKAKWASVTCSTSSCGGLCALFIDTQDCVWIATMTTGCKTGEILDYMSILSWIHSRVLSVDPKFIQKARACCRTDMFQGVNTKQMMTTMITGGMTQTNPQRCVI
jgi:hypothetical protein